MNKNIDSKNTSQKCTYENILFKMHCSGLIWSEGKINVTVVPPYPWLYFLCFSDPESRAIWKPAILLTPHQVNNSLNVSQHLHYPFPFFSYQTFYHLTSSQGEGWVQHSKTFRERETAVTFITFINFYYSKYKLYHKHVCIGKKTVYIGISTIHGFRQPLGGLGT